MPSSLYPRAGARTAPRRGLAVLQWHGRRHKKAHRGGTGELHARHVLFMGLSTVDMQEPWCAGTNGRAGRGARCGHYLIRMWLLCCAALYYSVRVLFVLSAIGASGVCKISRPRRGSIACHKYQEQWKTCQQQYLISRTPLSGVSHVSLQAWAEMYDAHDKTAHTRLSAVLCLKDRPSVHASARAGPGTMPCADLPVLAHARRVGYRARTEHQWLYGGLC